MCNVYSGTSVGEQKEGTTPRTTGVAVAEGEVRCPRAPHEGGARAAHTQSGEGEGPTLPAPPPALLLSAEGPSTVCDL